MKTLTINENYTITLKNGRTETGVLKNISPLKLRTDSTTMLVLPNHIIHSITLNK